MSAKINNIRLALYSASHLIVDMCCFYVLYAGVIARFGDSGHDIAVLCFMLYNCAAFGAQVFFGRLADRKKNHTSMAELGCILLAAAVLAVYLPFDMYKGSASYGAVVLCALIAAAGNALFHTGGGTDTLLHAEGRMTPNGVFVAPGAVGVALGRLIGKSGGLYPAFEGCPAGTDTRGYIHAAMIFAALTAYFFCRAAKALDRPDVENGAAEYRFSRPGRSAVFIISASVAVVTMRALVGAYMPVRTDSPLLSSLGAGLLPVIFAVCAALGKALGGILGDLAGARITAVVSLAASAVLFAAGIYVPAAVFAAVLLFNITMPITLCAAVSEMPGRCGEAFGLTTMGLLIGSLPEYVIKLGYYPRLALTLPLIIASAVLMLLCCAGKKDAAGA